MEDLIDKNESAIKSVRINFQKKKEIIENFSSSYRINLLMNQYYNQQSMMLIAELKIYQLIIINY